MIEIKQLLNNEKDKAVLFAKKVYIECKDESYSEQGIETFCNFVDNKEITKSFKVYGAFEDNVLKGLIATDRRKRHINLFFVDKVSQGKGIGKKLMSQLELKAKSDSLAFIRLNSASTRLEAHKFYENIGYLCDKIQKRFIKIFD